MKNILEDKLLEGICGGALNGNRLAFALLDIVRNGKFFSASRRELAAYFVSASKHEKFTGENIKNPIIENANFSDLRFLYVTFAGIKKYPVREDALKYGLSFLKDSEPVNSIFIGANGVGKTSIYSALEYAGMRKINSALMRGYERKIGQPVDKLKDLEEDQSAFFIHSGRELKDISICLFTKCKEIRLEGEDLLKKSGKPEITEAFYCSDYDVRELETNKDYTRFMLRQIGLNHFYQALQLLYYLGVYVRSEQKKAEESIWQENQGSISEPIWRLKLGIAIGHLNNIEIKDLDLLSLRNVIAQNDSFQLVKNTLESTISSLNEERSKFYNEKAKGKKREDWFTIGVIEQYDKLTNLLIDFRNKKFFFEDSKKNDLLQNIDTFINFRNKLILEINELKFSLDKNGDARLNLIDKIVTELKSLTGNENPKGLFESEIEATQFEKEYHELKTYLEDCLKNIFQKWKSKIESSIESLLSDYFDIDNDKLVVNLEINYSKGVLELIDRVTDEMGYMDIHQFVKFDVNIMTACGNLTSDKRFPVKPRQYLNTFKFKLFCVAIKIALGCVVKETYDINYPFIIDDVFDSSDFDSRLQLKQFVENIIKCHDELLKYNKYAMQLLFFTQDDLIANQLYKGLIASKGEKNVKIGRIYDYHDAKDSDIELLLVYKRDNIFKTKELQICDNKDIDNKYISLEDKIS